MHRPSTRRQFLQTTAGASSLLIPAVGALATDEKARGDISVLVWDEQQPAQKEAYPNFIGNWIADHLGQRPGMVTHSVKLNDPDQGLGAGVLDNARVLIWWGHQRHAEIAPETGKKIVERIKAGQLSLLALHSAHWSTPFMEAMNERSRQVLRARKATDQMDHFHVHDVPPPQRYTQPKMNSRLTPYTVERRYPSNKVDVELHLPFCCFPSYRTDGKPSQVRVREPKHPIARQVPSEFEIPHTEMYGEPFHVPEPDALIFEERWATGDWFRSGLVWRVGKGHVFYFRPGHETYPVYKEPVVLRILENAVRWMGGQ